MTCEFCIEFNCFEDSQYFKLTNWNYKDRILKQNDYFNTIPAYGPLTYPYLLIVSKQHFLNTLQLPYYYYPHLINIINELTSHYSIFCKRWLFFEHAGCEKFNMSSCIDHFHIHMIPYYENIIDNFVKLFKPSQYPSLGNITELNDPYLLISENLEKDILIADNITVVPKQYFRKLLANAIDVKSWDWRLGMNQEYLVKMYKDFI